MEHIQRNCRIHGLTDHALRSGRTDSYRCLKCTVDSVTKHRKSKRLILLTEAGGKCVRCGYDSYLGALQFHHRDPSIKSFEIGGKGQTYSLARMREEIEKCDLLCANCHAEVHGSLA